MSEVKNQEQVEQELAKLREMKPKVRRRTMFGDNNHEAIEAQIEVLDEDLTDDDVYDRLITEDEETGDTEGEWTQHVVDAALRVIQWRDGEEEESPSKSWEPLVQK